MSYQRPPTLHRYGSHAILDAALREGQFRLRPSGACLTLSFSTQLQPALFDAFNGDSCLIIHNTEEFGERLHRAVQKALPSWMGIDGAVQYGSRSALGAAFSKTPQERSEKEWLFAWRSAQAASLHPVIITIGSIESFAELKSKDAHLN